MKQIRFQAVAVAALLAITLTGCNSTDTAAEDDSTPAGTAVETQLVTRGDIYNENTLSGSIIAAREVSVSAALPTAKVLSVNVKVGDTVAQDQVLFTLDPKDIQKQYQPLLDNYNRTKTLMDETIRQAQNNVDNTAALLEIGAASQTELDQANLNLLQAQTNAESSLSQLDESLKDVRDALDDATVRAPIAGVVTTVNAVENNPVGQSAGVVIAENQKPEISVSVSESLIPSLNEGDIVSVIVPAVSAEPFDASIRAISPTTNSQTNLYEIKIPVPTDMGYQVGMFANVTFRLNAHTDVVTIPSETILTNGAEQYVFIINDAGTASKITVTTGLSTEEHTEILEGLAGGERLVTKGQAYLADGAVVRVVSQDVTEE